MELCAAVANAIALETFPLILPRILKYKRQQKNNHQHRREDGKI